MITAADLRSVAPFAALSDADLAALAAEAAEVTFGTGDVVFRQGEPGNTMYALLTGSVVAAIERDGQDAGLYSLRAGMLSGWLPRSRMTAWASTARAAEPVRAAAWSREAVTELITDLPALDEALAGALADRIRESTRVEQQRDKLMALGKLSAGLAHELNNPAAAVRSAADALRTRLDELPARVHALSAHGLDAGQLAFACALSAHVRPASTARLSSVARGEREDELADWMADHGVEQGYALAEAFVEAGWTPDDLDGIARGLPDAALPDVVRWTESSLAADLLLRDIASAADRVSDIVASVKGYSHMDEAPALDMTDVRVGLDQALKLLAYPIKNSGVKVERRYDDDTPEIEAYGGMLNQVWTNLIDNALDAMPGGGTLALVARPDGDHVLVEVIDTGTGIAPEKVGRVFDPFFTTKGVGEGSVAISFVHQYLAEL